MPAWTADQEQKREQILWWATAQQHWLYVVPIERAVLFREDIDS